MRKIIPYILAFIATINLIWLFAFDYRIPDFIGNAVESIIHFSFKEDNAPEEEEQAAEAAEETSEQEAQETVPAGQETAPADPAVPGTAEGDGTETAQEGTEAETTCRPTEGNAPNIRSGPGSNFDVIGAAGADEIMVVRGEAELGWLPIRTAAGLEGYVFADLVEVIEQAE